MKRLPPEKRNKLILIIIGTVALVGLIYFFLITPEKDDRQKLAGEVKNASAQLEVIKKAIKQADANASMADAMQTALDKAEEDIAYGDLYAWTYDTIRRFKTGYHVEIPSIGQPVLGDTDIIPSFPYKQIRIKVKGFGYYHDIGKFLSDLENKFPHVRVVNLAMDPATGIDAAPEKLAFQVELVALVKPNT